jgi:alpha-beta hydrolase superfamily lysophospholipase
MIKEEYTLTVDNALLKVRTWIPEKPVSAVQVVHGMMEHSERYSEFANWMCSQNIAVFANDHRGHGQSSSEYMETGYFAVKDGWKKVVDDLDQVRSFFDKKYPGIPVFMLGHSMGSLLARNYLAEHGTRLSGLILSGSLEQDAILIKLGKILADITIKLRGDKQRSRLLAYLSYGKFSGKFKPRRTEFDWLSSLDNEVDRYINDPLCGQAPTNNFYRELFKGMSSIQQSKKFEKINKDLPVLLFSGVMDPVGEFGKAPVKIESALKKAGFRNTGLKLYENGRHEMLNERNRSEVFEDIAKWIINNLG